MNSSMSTKIYSKGKAKPDKDKYIGQTCIMNFGLIMSYITQKMLLQKILSGKVMHNIRA